MGRAHFDVAVAALYFQVRENTDPDPEGYNRFFAEWDNGQRRTPNWGEMKTLLAGQASVADFMQQHSIDVVEEAHAHFSYLSAFTHTAAYASDGEAVTAINTTGVAPAFDDSYFERGCGLVASTVLHIATLWQVTYPGIARTEPLGPAGSDAYNALFPPPNLALAPIS